MIKEKLGLKVTKSKLGHHSNFAFKGVSVENHYELSNSYFGGKRTKFLEHRLKELILDGSWKPSDECSYYLTSANFNAVFLIWHMGTHFCTERINLRQICDWVLFIKRYHNEIDWITIRNIWNESGLEGFANAINSVATKFFYIPSDWVPGTVFSDRLADRIMNDIFAVDIRKGSGLVNLPHNLRSSWKYRLTTGRSCVLPVLESAWMHIVHRGDLVEKSI